MWQKNFPLWSGIKSAGHCTVCPKFFIWRRATLLLVNGTTFKTVWTPGILLTDLWSKDNADELYLPPARTWSTQQRHIKIYIFFWMAITLDLCSILGSSYILYFQLWGPPPLGLPPQISKLIKQEQLCCSKWSDSGASERRTKQKVSISLVLPVSIWVQPWHRLPYYAIWRECGHISQEHTAKAILIEGHVRQNPKSVLWAIERIIMASGASKSWHNNKMLFIFWREKHFKSTEAFAHYVQGIVG